MQTYSNGRSTKWKRVSRANPCPICDHPDWCLTTGPVDAPTAAICARIESTKRAGDGGWLHELRDDDWQDRPRHRRVEFAAAADSAIVFGALSDQFVKCMSVNHVNMLADKLDVTPESLERLHVGYSVQHKAYTFPMESRFGRVCGIRLRTDDGRKFSIKGGREGLFVPHCALPGDPFGGGGTLLICEGPTDTAALLDLGFSAVGRPSCLGGVSLLVDLVCDYHPDDVVIVADGDGPGQRGARCLAGRLVGYVASGVQIITPPNGVKDARQWKQNGATQDDILAAIDEAPIMQLRYGVKAVAR